MSTKKVSNKAIAKLLVDVRLFDAMPAPRKAAFRARVSRYLAIVGDPDSPQFDQQYADLITAVQDRVGKAAKKKAAVMTVEGLQEEYSESFDGMTDRQKAAFKAKAKRLYNRMIASDKDATAVEDLLHEVAQAEKAAHRVRILQLAKQAGIIGKKEDDSDSE